MQGLKDAGENRMVLRGQLLFFDRDLVEEDLSGVAGDGLCEGEEAYEGELEALEDADLVN